MRRHQRFVIGGALLGFGLLAAVMANTEVRHASRATTRSTQPYGSAGMRAAINQETGELGLDTEPLVLTAEEQNALSTSSDGLVEVHHADGSTSMDLEGRFQTATVLVIDAQGNRHMSCVSTPEEARAALSHHTITPALEEK